MPRTPYSGLKTLAELKATGQVISMSVMNSFMSSYSRAGLSVVSILARWSPLRWVCEPWRLVTPRMTTS